MVKKELNNGIVILPLVEYHHGLILVEMLSNMKDIYIRQIWEDKIQLDEKLCENESDCRNKGI